MMDLGGGDVNVVLNGLVVECESNGPRVVATAPEGNIVTAIIISTNRVIRDMRTLPRRGYGSLIDPEYSDTPRGVRSSVDPGGLVNHRSS